MRSEPGKRQDARRKEPVEFRFEEPSWIALEAQEPNLVEKPSVQVHPSSERGESTEDLQEPVDLEVPWVQESKAAGSHTTLATAEPSWADNPEPSEDRTEIPSTRTTAGPLLDR